jgi:hypothetical protein
LPIVAKVAEKGCNSGFKLVIAENLKTVANTNFMQDEELWFKHHSSYNINCILFGISLIEGS